MNITIYSTANCGFCNMLKSYLTGKGISYEVKMADESPSIAAELFEKSGQLSVPFTLVTKDDGSQVSLLGFNRNEVDKAVGLV